MNTERGTPTKGVGGVTLAASAPAGLPDRTRPHANALPHLSLRNE
jgi:hypothetical protein